MQQDQHDFFDVAFNDSFSQRLGTRKMAGRVLAFFSNIEQQELFARCNSLLDVLNRAFADVHTDRVDKLQKSR